MDIDYDELYRTPPPVFGHPMLRYFALDPHYVNLNHGSFGAVPCPVLKAAAAVTLAIEANPDRYLRLESQPILRDARSRLARIIGAHQNEVVFVPNASMGVATVMRNFEWKLHDQIIVFNTTYGTVVRGVQYLSDVSPHPTISSVTLEFPLTHVAIIARFKQHVRALSRGHGKVVAIIDGIVSTPGVLMPWQDLVRVCREENIWSVVDAAHCIGQQVGIDLGKAMPDFWISNCHKWLFAKRSCAILYVPERNQHIVKTSIPTSAAYISPNARTTPNFVEQFESHGTIDYTSYLTVSSALDFRSWLGGEERINSYCRFLALQGGKLLSEILGTRVLDPNRELILNMVNVELPLPGSISASYEFDLAFKTKLLVEHNMYAAHYKHNGHWWTRCSAQIYNETSDFEKLGNTLLVICRELRAEFGGGA